MSLTNDNNSDIENEIDQLRTRYGIAFDDDDDDDDDYDSKDDEKNNKYDENVDQSERIFNVNRFHLWMKVRILVIQ